MTAKKIVLIGTDPSVEAPVLNARIRKAWLARSATVVHGRRGQRCRLLSYDATSVWIAPRLAGLLNQLEHGAVLNATERCNRDRRAKGALIGEGRWRCRTQPWPCR